MPSLSLSLSLSPSPSFACLSPTLSIFYNAKLFYIKAAKWWQGLSSSSSFLFSVRGSIFRLQQLRRKKRRTETFFSFLKKKFEKRETEKVVRGESNDYHKDRSCGLWLIPCCPPPSFKSLAFGTQELNVALGFTWWIQSTDIDLPLSCSLTELFNRNNLASLEGRHHLIAVSQQPNH